MADDEARSRRSSRSRARARGETRPTNVVSAFQPLKVDLLPSMLTFRPKVDRFFTDQLKPDAELTGLLNNPPKLSAGATERMDGRRVRLALVVVADGAGSTRPGILVHLRQSGRLVDRSRTDVRGVVLLRFSDTGHAHEDHSEAESEAEGTIRVFQPVGQPIDKDVKVPAGEQHTVVEVEIDDLLHEDDKVENGEAEGDTPNDGGIVAAVRSFGPLDLADNPLDRLPADFTTALCSDLSTILGPPTDPILGLMAAGGSSDFRTRRLPLIKRLTIPRIGLVPADGPPRRYLVRVRQEWTFLGYTLGELADVEALDPGQIVEETRRQVERVTSRATRQVDESVSQALATVTSTLNQLSSIDTLIRDATSTSTLLAASGFGPVAGAAVGGGIGALVGGPIGALIGGGIGAIVGGAFDAPNPVGTATTAVSRTTTNTSLLVNSLVRQSQSRVNQAIRMLTSTARTVESQLTQAIDQVSPLLSRVTNLLRWIVYENYAVCTHVEDIVEVRDVRITALGNPAQPLFADADIVEYRRIFSPRLLEPRLRLHFDILERAIQQKRGAQMPIAAVAFDIDFSANIFGADLRVTIDPAGATEESVPLTLRPGRSRASGRVRFTTPVPVDQIGQARLTLTLRTDIVDFPPFPFPFNPADVLRGSVGVTRIRFRFESTPQFVREQVEHLGTDLLVSNDATTDDQTVPLEPPQPAIFTEFDPLFLHVNRNRAYYFGLLAQAALAEPGLRDNAPQLASFPYDHPLWRLPIIGFEGDRVLVIGDVDPEDPDVATFLEDEGAATIIQLAAPGAYAEALQGLLQLADAAGKIHPALIPLPAPVMPPLALVDLTGKQLQVVPAPDGVSPTPTPPTPPIPPVPPVPTPP